MARTPKDKGADERVVIQKYANRRLYNKATSTYITLDDLAKMVRDNVDFVVYDAKSNEDITRKVLTQIIFEEETSSEGRNLLPIQFLRQLISFYGNSMQAFLPSYLEMSLDTFTRQQEQFRSQLAAGKIPTLQPEYLQGQVRQNMQMFEQAMKMFSPFGFAAGQKPEGESAGASAEADPERAKEADLDDLKQQIAAMQAQINKLASSKE